jgi:hypothetical protein|tara:strand:- start:11205 stop:11930 length:726 start_codon:yes stop_codon:yes gene_type:complete
MAKYGPSSVGYFLVSGYSLAGTMTEVTYKKLGGTENTDALGDSWQEATPTGRLSGELYQTGWFDDASKSSVDALIVNPGTTIRVICVAPAGSTAGSAMTGFEGAFSAEVERLIEKEGLHKLNCTYNVSGAIEEGAIIEALAARTATGNSASVDNSASSASGGSGYIQITAESGSSPTLAAVLQHSSDDTTFTTLGTFTTSGTVGAERITVTGTVNRYIRVNATIGGSSTPSVTYTVAFSRG